MSAEFEVTAVEDPSAIDPAGDGPSPPRPERIGGRGTWARECLWEGAFVRALGEGGHVARAAALVGVSARAVSKRRRRHPSFALAVEAALDRYRAGVSAALATAALKRGSTLDSGPIESRMRRPSTARISPAAEQRFLLTLSETANVRMSADAAGLSVAGFYRRRGADDAFRAQWDGAVEDGRVALELMLLAVARRSLDPGPDGPSAIEVGMPTVSVSDAIDILKLSKGMDRAKREDGGSRWRPRVRSLDEVKDSILGKLSRMAKARWVEQEKEGWSWSDEHELAVPPGWVKA